MALSDPELELLTELLEEDPSADVFVTVAQEMIRREQWSEAVRILVAALKDANGPELVSGKELLAIAALEEGQPLRALDAIKGLPPKSLDDRRIARVRVLAYEGTGHIDEARAAAEAYLKNHPGDTDILAVLERADLPQGDGYNRATDPFVNTERAEQYVILGRPDRAIRLYRRILFHNPGNPTLLARLRELADEPVYAEDDLSEEIHLADAPLPPDITETHVELPDLTMPSPQVGPRGFYVAGEDVTDGVTDFEKPTIGEVPDFDMPSYGASLADTVLPDDEITQIDLSRAEIKGVIDEQRYVRDATDPGAAAPTGPQAASQVTEPLAAMSMDDDDEETLVDADAALKAAGLAAVGTGAPAPEEEEEEDDWDDKTDPELDPSQDKVEIGDQPTNVVAKDADLTDLAKKVSTVKRRRSLFRR